MTPDELAAIMAEHHKWPYGEGREHCVACGPAFDWPCLPYRLAADLDAERARVGRVRALLDSPLRFVQLGEISAALDGAEQQGADQ